MTAIRGSKRPVPTDAALAPAQKVNAQLNSDIHNRFDIEVIDSATGEVKQRAQAQNVICNQLWTRLLTPATYFNYIHYGTGTGTPASVDTSLFTFLGYGTPVNSDDIFDCTDVADLTAGGWVSLSRKIKISENMAVGSTLTEVGIGYGTTAATLCTHAMLKDMNGNSISIAKTATDIINIYATVFVHWAQSAVSPNLFIPVYNNTSANTYTYNAYGYLFAWIFGVYCSADKMFDGLAHMLPGLAPAPKAAGKAIATSFSAVNKTLTLTVTRFGVSDGNVGGGGSLMLGMGNGVAIGRVGLGEGMIVLDSRGVHPSGFAITGEAIGTGDGTTVDFATNFSCPSSATIYIDGVAASPTVDNVPLLFNDMGRYFLPLYHIGASVNNVDIMPKPFFNFGGSDVGGIGTGIWYNPYYSIGISSYISGSYITVYASDDGETWVQLSGSAGTINVNAAYQHYKYWKIISTDNTYSRIYSFTAPNLTGKNIHFTTAPTNGAVITADYTTPFIPKDTNHVYDLTVTIQFGEYTS